MENMDNIQKRYNKINEQFLEMFRYWENVQKQTDSPKKEDHYEFQVRYIKCFNEWIALRKRLNLPTS